MRVLFLLFTRFCTRTLPHCCCALHVFYIRFFFSERSKTFKGKLSMIMLEMLPDVDQVKLRLFLTISSFAAKNVVCLPVWQNTLNSITTRVILSPTMKSTCTTLSSKIKRRIPPNVCLVALTRLGRRIAITAVKIGEIEQGTNTENSR